MPALARSARMVTTPNNSPGPPGRYPNAPIRIDNPLTTAGGDGSTIGAWAFDETDGGSVRELSGKLHVGTVMGAFAWAPGRWGRARSQRWRRSDVWDRAPADWHGTVHRAGMVQDVNVAAAINCSAATRRCTANGSSGSTGLGACRGGRMEMASLATVP